MSENRFGFLMHGLGALALLTACMPLSAPSVDSRSVEVAPVYRVSTPTGTAAGHYAVGRLDLGEGRFESAIKRFRRAVSLDPAYVDAYNGLGVALGALGRFDDAAAEFRKGLSQAPDDSLLLNNLGFALMKAGNLDAASVALGRSLQLDSGSERTLENLRLLAEMGAPGGSGKGTPAEPANRVASTASPVGISGREPAESASRKPTQPASMEVARSEGRLVPVAPGILEYRDSRLGAPVATTATATATATATSPASSPDLRAALRDPQVAGRAITAPTALASTTPAATTPAATTPAATTPAATTETRAPAIPAPVSRSAKSDGGKAARLSRAREGQQAVASLRLPQQANEPMSKNASGSVSAWVWRVEVSNAAGVRRLARSTAKQLIAQGVAVSHLSLHERLGLEQTQILYRRGHEANAERLRRLLPVEARLVPSDNLRPEVDLRLVIGKDLAPVSTTDSGAPFSGKGGREAVSGNRPANDPDSA